MGSKAIKCFAIVSLLGVGFFLIGGCNVKDKEGTLKSQQDGYSSPRDVFNAFRKARNSRDYRTEFYCLTPDSQDQATFGLVEEQPAYQLLEFPIKAKVLETLTKYGPKWSIVEAEYKTKYHKKYGIDPPCSAEEIVRNGGPALAKRFPREVNAPPPSSDDALLYDIVLSLVPDKAKLYEEVNLAHTGGDALPRIGKLHGLDIHGDTAVGYLRETVVSYQRGTTDQTKKKAEDVVWKPFSFRRLNGRWFVDEFTNSLNTIPSPTTDPDDLASGTMVHNSQDPNAPATAPPLPPFNAGPRN